MKLIAKFCLWSLVFSLAYTQSPLYTSNQNQYFLHGLARAGLGFLEQDWLANTLDPAPVFSFLVYLTYRYLRLEALFYVFYALQMGVYLFSLLGIISSIYNIRQSFPRFLLYTSLLIAIHSAALRFALSRSLGANWGYVLEDGVADQRLLGSVFEPSTFAVFLVLSIYLFIQGRPTLAVLSAVLAATFHPTYLLSAGVLTLAYLLVTAGGSLLSKNRGKGWDGERRKGMLKALSLGGLALLGVLPILFYVYTNFAASPAETTAQARQVLVNFRIPHHALPGWWFDATAVVKILLVGVALALIRRKPLFPILLIAFLASVGLTLVQVFLHDDALALIFPWRLSIFLVPIATALILAHLLTGLLDRFSSLESRFAVWLTRFSLGLLGLVILIGLVRLKLDFERKAAIPERPLMEYVAANRHPGEVYLTPVKMQDFRLEAGAPVYVDFKSIPYQESDVLEWYRRIQSADRFYKENDCSLLPEMAAQAGVTHIVLEAPQVEQPCQQLHLVFQDPNFELYSLR